MMAKFEGYPVEVWDLYGCERHPEFIPYGAGGGWVEETYDDRRKRAEIFMRTFSYIPDGGPLHPQHILLIDEDHPIDVLEEMGLSYSFGRQGTYTKGTALFGRRPQSAVVIDPTGHIIQVQSWQRVEQNDELLSYIFGVEPGLP